VISRQHRSDADEAAAVERLLTAADVAAVLGVPRSLVYALVRRGDLPSIRVGDRYVRFRAEAIEQWIEHREASERSHVPRSVRASAQRPAVIARGT
jgi:excisionase family DNA binding protein